VDDPVLDIQQGDDVGSAAAGGAAVWRIRLRGEVDVSTAPTLDHALDDVERRGASVVILDLREVTFLDSSGLRSIVRAQHHLGTRDRTLMVEGLSPAAERVLEITGLLEQLTSGAGDRTREG
jgi:anti-sigma B factor antagonist